MRSNTSGLKDTSQMTAPKNISEEQAALILDDLLEILRARNITFHGASLVIFTNDKGYGHLFFGDKQANMEALAGAVQGYLTGKVVVDVGVRVK